MISVPSIDPHFVVDNDVTTKMQSIANSDGIRNVLVTGPTGTGKTALASHIAATLKRPYYEAVVGQLTEPLDLIGAKGVKDGQTFFKESQFVRSIETDNCIICLDEVNRAPSNILNLLIPLLDHRGYFFVEELNREVRVGKNIVFIACINVGSEYSGVYKLDEAIHSRFPYRFEVEYLKQQDEAKMLNARTGCGDDASLLLSRVAADLRSKTRGIGDGFLTKGVSTRQLIAAAYVVANGLSIQDALELTIIPSYEKDQGTKSERAQVIQAIQLITG